MIMPGRAEPALEAVLVPERLLERVERRPAGHPLDRLDLEPSAETASIVHDLADTPSTTTVHAPQLLVSQPMWVPVSPKFSRRRWTRRSRGSTSASRASPLTVTLM